ncbi:alpha/beta hydrolase-fold protein [Neisseria yangbaofengii]|uniref:alpha/beta hydrolase-fold protein n=1 Tax=Neisseria yangbaofengii TaxID=2709396 RepID=UPI001AE08D2B|nr:alpha/beta hydrolase-fold protein [Neisseria yangbaofengii]
MKRTFFALFLLPAFSVAKTDSRACLNGHRVADIPLDLSKGRYIEGSIRFSGVDFARKGMTLNAISDGLERMLFHNQTNGQQFLLWLPSEKWASLSLKAEENPRICYELTLKQSNATIDGVIRENAAPQSPRLQALQQDLKHDKQALEKFWQEMAGKGTPLVEGTGSSGRLLTFLYRGAQKNVRVLGAPSNDHEWMEKLPDSDVWYKSFTVPNDLRLSYRLAPDVPSPENLDSNEKEAQYRKRRALLAVLQPDPFNSRRFGRDSLVDLNQDAFSDGLDKPKGRLKQYAFTSKMLNNTRRIWIYQTNLDGKAKPVWLYLFDGQDYLEKTQLPAVLDRLRAQINLPPIIAVMIDNHERSKELPANPQFADMVVQELIPFIEQQTGYAHHRESAVIAGSSYGGLAAAYIALRHPQQFANVLPMSGSFWWKNKTGEGIQETFASSSKLPLKWYIMAGKYETARKGEAAAEGIVFSSRQLVGILQRRNHMVTYREYSGGHDYAVWQKALADGVINLFGER